MSGNGNEPNGSVVQVGVGFVECSNCKGSGRSKTGKSRCGRCRGKKRVLAEVQETSTEKK
ncbi:MAG: hypothetical protein HY225_01575 [Candidatus Vogelbacteria bacterium]|nr:hypothetical protein [Candidatus Vogelbacteria bacterium]